MIKYILLLLFFATNICALDELPDDMLTNVFGFCENTEVDRVLPKVCKLFLRLNNHRHLFASAVDEFKRRDCDIQKAITLLKDSNNPPWLTPEHHFQILSALAPKVHDSLKDKEIVQWLIDAEEKGDALAQSNLGYIYSYGIGVTKDEKIALGLFKQGAQQGDRIAQFNLANLYQVLPATCRSPEVKRYYKLAAKQGLDTASYEVAEIYRLNKTEKNIKKAKAIFQGLRSRGELTPSILLACSIGIIQPITYLNNLRAKIADALLSISWRPFH